MNTSVVKQQQSWQRFFPEMGLMVFLGSMSILLTYQLGHLWARPHFQFAPVAWIAFAVFAIGAARKIAMVEGLWRSRFGKFFCFVGLAAGLVSAQVFSPWLAHVATAAFLAGWGLLRMPSTNAWTWLGWTLLIWVTIPLPGNKDELVVNALQRISAQSASHLLDLFGVLHLRQGNIIEIRASKLFVDQACSGIDSFYALLAVTLLIGLWQKRPMIVGVFSLLCVPLFAWLGNVLRLTTIVWLLDAFKIDLSYGTKHTLLGLATFGLSAGLLYISSLGFSSLFRRLPGSAVVRSQTRWARIYNTIACFPGEPPAVKEEASEYFRETPVEKEKRKIARLLPRVNRFELSATFLIALVCLGFSSFKIASSNEGEAPVFTLPHFEQSQVDQVFAQDKLPKTLGKAEQIRLDKHHRPRDTFYGEHSRTWQYHHPICDFQLSVDFPFLGFHPLWICYTTTGNRLVEDPEILTVPGAENVQITEMQLADELGSPAYVWFAFVDQRGEAFAPDRFKPDLKQRFTTRVLDAFKANVVPPQVVTYQYQLYFPAGRVLTVAEKQEVIQIFADGLPYVTEQVKALSQKQVD